MYQEEIASSVLVGLLSWASRGRSLSTAFEGGEGAGPVGIGEHIIPNKGRVRSEGPQVGLMHLRSTGEARVAGLGSEGAQ